MSCWVESAIYCRRTHTLEWQHTRSAEASTSANQVRNCIETEYRSYSNLTPDELKPMLANNVSLEIHMYHDKAAPHRLPLAYLSMK